MICSKLTGDICPGFGKDETGWMNYYLGVDIGSSKTQVLIADENGQQAGVGLAGPGNHQTVGYEGMHSALQDGVSQALSQARISVDQICGSGFGISGFDWPADEPMMLETISKLGLDSPLEIQNDAVLGLAAGAEQGWGIAVVSGTGCNCWGWDRDRRNIGRVTGFGEMAGEAAGSTELVFHGMQLVAQAWTRRGPQTSLAQGFVSHAGAEDVEDLLEGYTNGRYVIDGSAAPMVFQMAEAGDAVACQLVQWAGSELGELAKAVIRQLRFQQLKFDVVMVGSMFDAGSLLVEPMRETILQLAPKARLVKLDVPPVVGAVLLGMQAGGLDPTPEIRGRLKDSLV
jgi:N-acetylglucosamine kinase-like BadF-type ATPase